MEWAKLKDARILVVEDSWQIATALKTLLRRIGAEVIGPAATLAEAEQLTAEQKFDFAVVDINLKGEATYPLIDKLHDQGVRVVVATSYTALPQTTEQKIAAIVHKPFSEPQLLAALYQAALD